MYLSYRPLSLSISVNHFFMLGAWKTIKKSCQEEVKKGNKESIDGKATCLKPVVAPHWLTAAWRQSQTDWPRIVNNCLICKCRQMAIHCSQSMSINRGFDSTGCQLVAFWCVIFPSCSNYVTVFGGISWLLFQIHEFLAGLCMEAVTVNFWIYRWQKVWNLC